MAAIWKQHDVSRISLVCIMSRRDEMLPRKPLSIPIEGK